MVHLYDTQTQRIIWSGEQYLVDGRPGVVVPPLVLLTEVVIPRPDCESGQTVDPVTVIDVQAGTLTRGWSDIRPKTDAEAQTVATQLTIWQSLTSAERRALWSMADLEGPVGDTALLILGALMSATETESRNPATKQLLGAAMQLGIVASLERARKILQDPGFTLE